MEEGQARNAGWAHEIIGFTDTDRPWDMIAKAIKDRGINANQLQLKRTFKRRTLRRINKIIPKCGFRSAEEKVRELRLIKDEKELSILREAAKMADYAVEVGVNAIKEDRSELEVLAIMNTN